MTVSHFPTSKINIIVVDDNPDLVEIVRIMLESKGFNVTCAYSGTELLAGLEEQKPDLIFLDIMMPYMNGFEVLTQLKENPDTASIPVILLTAKNLYDDVVTGYRIGAEYYITKPFESTQLFSGISLLLGGHDSPPSPPTASA